MAFACDSESLTASQLRGGLMAMIDKPRITAARKLEGMGYTFADGVRPTT